jgi:hypothetical protein
MDRWWHRHRDTRARQCISWSKAGSGARKLTDGGGKERGGHRDAVLGLTGARAVVWQSSNGVKCRQQWNSMVVALKLRGRGKEEWEVQ